jgi:CbiX
MTRAALAAVATLALTLLSGCQGREPPAPSSAAAPTHKVGVLLVNHGSRQKPWRDMLLDVEAKVRDRLLALPDVKGVRTAFNEYVDPSIAQQMKAFDDEGYDEVIVVPIFLTIGGHVNSDLPNLLGLKNDPKALETLPGKGVPVYRPRARVILLDTIDSDEFLKVNILRRTRALLKDGNGSQYGVTLAAYGDDKFNQQWEALMAEIGQHLKTNLGIDTINYAWSGHLVNYSMDPTRKAVDQILASKKKDIVVSVYVAYDHKFQRDVIGEGVRHASRPQDVLYVETEAILPDESLNDWVVESVKNGLSRGTATAPG